MPIYESASAHERLDTRQTPAHNAQYVQRVIHKRAIADLLGAQRGVCRNQIGLSSDVTDRQHQTRPATASLEGLFTANAADQRFRADYVTTDRPTGDALPIANRLQPESPLTVHFTGIS